MEDECQAFFHAWERRLADVTKDRVVRPFEWGLDWIPENGHSHGALPADAIGRYVSEAWQIPTRSSRRRRSPTTRCSPRPTAIC
jgi:hypothetical protein